MEAKEGNQNCGTCRWWRKRDETTGACDYPLDEALIPASMRLDRFVVADSSGTRCPTYERREEPLPVCRLCGQKPEALETAEVAVWHYECITRKCQLGGIYTAEEWRKLHGRDSDAFAARVVALRAALCRIGNVTTAEARAISDAAIEADDRRSR